MLYPSLDLMEATVEAAAARGRQKVKVIHGPSTSGGAGRSIKTALHAMLDTGELAQHVTSWWPSTGHLVVGLRVDARPRSQRLQLRDVW